MFLDAFFVAKPVDFSPQNYLYPYVAQQKSAD
jgi:hypothetical protein